MIRDNYHLTPDEKSRILDMTPVRYSMWHLADLAEPGLYRPENKSELNALLREKADVDRESETLEEEWLAACEQLEAQQTGIESR